MHGSRNLNPACAFPRPAFRVPTRCLSRPQALALTGLALFALLGAFPAWCADDALLIRVAVAPLVNESEDASGGLVGRAVTETIDLNLRLFGKYRVERPAGLEEVKDAASAASLAEREHLDSVVLGSVRKGRDGSYLLTATPPSTSSMLPTSSPAASSRPSPDSTSVSAASS
jgi:hypothetical protein